MREVIRIEEPQEGKKPVELTHYMCKVKGWQVSDYILDCPSIKSIIYVGKCQIDGDMFALIWDDGVIGFYKGHLNSGRY